MTNIERILKENKNQRLVAKVLWISKRDGNGILITVEGHEIYFDNSVTGHFFSRIKANDYLEFEFNQKITECLCATNIIID